MFLIATKGDQPTHGTKPTTRWRTPSQQGTAAAVEEDVSGGPEGGKLAVQPCINAVTPGSLFHIEDQSTHRRFLSDTAAVCFILGPSQHGPAGQLIDTSTMAVIPAASAANERGGASSHHSGAASVRPLPPPISAPLHRFMHGWSGRQDKYKQC